MSTLYDVQNAMVNVITPAIYPNTTSSPSILGNSVSLITVTSGGINYTTATATFTGDGQGAIATVQISAGIISGITILDGGYGYSTAPTIVITGDGSGATATASITPITVSIFPGDSLKIDLDSLLKSRQAVIAVFAINGMNRNSTRFPRVYMAPIKQVSTLFLTVSNNTVTVTGTITAGEAAMIIVNNIGYSYKILSTDTINTIASSLAALIPTASATGNVITITSWYSIIARVSVQGTARKILHTQEGLCRARIICWRAEVREILGNAIQIGFGEYGYYLPMPDFVSASIRPSKISEVNSSELDLAFIRDYVYLVEYHTTKVTTYQSIEDIVLTVDATLTPPT